MVRSLMDHHQLKHIVKIVGMQWQYEYQFVVCALSAMQQTPHCTQRIKRYLKYKL